MPEVGQVKLEYQREYKEGFHGQMIEAARDDIIMQRTNLMLILYVKETTIESFLISSYRIELLFDRRGCYCIV